MSNLEEQVKQEKKDYFKNWRKNNKDKIKVINKRYWEKRAIKNSQNRKEK